jgi:hypothetical protein
MGCFCQWNNKLSGYLPLINITDYGRPWCEYEVRHSQRNVAESSGCPFLLDIKQFLALKYNLWYVSFLPATTKINNYSKLDLNQYLAHSLLVDLYTMLSTKLNNLETQWHYLPSGFKTPRKTKAIRTLYKTFPNVIALLILLTAVVLLHLLS